MSEADLLEQISARSDSIWTLVQFWISLSFAAIVAIHYSSKQLSGLLIATLLLLYTGYSLTILRSLATHSDSQGAAWSMMVEMESAGTLSPLGSQSLESSRKPGRIMLPGVIVITYGATMIYIFATYIRRRRIASESLPTDQKDST